MLIPVFVLSMLLIGSYSYIVYDKFFNDSKNNLEEKKEENKNDTFNNKLENLEQDFQQMISKRESCIGEF